MSLVNPEAGLSWSPSFGLVFLRGTTAVPTAPADLAIGTSAIVERTSGVLAMNMATHDVDTIATLPSSSFMLFVRDANGTVTRSGTTHPFPAQDKHAVMSDGSIAILRSREYRVEWIAGNGTRSTSDRIPYPWVSLTADDRARLLDSIETVRKAKLDRANADVAAARAAGRSAGINSALAVPFDSRFIPDYRPAIRQAPAMLAFVGDADNNVWVLVNMPSAPAGSDVYDVINRQGQLVDRVVLPNGRHLTGFGPRGVVFLFSPAGSGQVERARLR